MKKKILPRHSYLFNPDRDLLSELKKEVNEVYSKEKMEDLC